MSCTTLSSVTLEADGESFVIDIEERIEGDLIHLAVTVIYATFSQGRMSCLSKDDFEVEVPAILFADSDPEDLELFFMKVDFALNSAQECVVDGSQTITMQALGLDPARGLSEIAA